jgi:DNA uptake protein ComE-like DNA-binding protein
MDVEFENNVSKLQPAVEKMLEKKVDPYATWSKELVESVTKMTHAVKVLKAAMQEKGHDNTADELRVALMTIHDHLVEHVK